MKKTLYKFLSTLLVMGGVPMIAWADETDIDDFQYVGGTIPIIRIVEVSGSGYANFFSSITAEDYAVGYKETNNGATTLTVTANTEWKVLVKNDSFTPIEGYVKPASDLHLKIKNKTVVNEGEGDGGTLSDVFTNFAPLSETAQVLWSNTSTGDNRCTADIDFKVLLNAAKDIPGIYTTTVTYTVSAP
ncbi:hypothetical protein SAMN02746065_10671 [Desulfocicer vacuolatum DSM 3385]|uniref:SipW-cognate class signal peptide n=1 Tax=Desulfocicer vacuolatum DSM 3385 TaxID=1121400 RepID=A0A1W2ASZ6_9BACT|nr:hypothetical protein [Desulfocicer vacuolatum]SMC63714.1 hypothetical protein SAMN02746065_10671 [Desulfocicer vacuolatum DSM 3385]